MKLGWCGATLCLAIGGLIGCSNTPKTPDVAANIRQAIDQAGIKNVTVDQDRTKGVVTLNGRVPAETDKARADQIAQSIAQGQVVANQIQVAPQGLERVTKTVDEKLDKAIGSNLDAVLIQNGWDKAIKHSEKNGVVTLTGDVDSQQLRADIERMAAAVPNVQQVVNTLQVKDQKASSTR
ncbi:MAG: transport-associated protein [Candidatus Solibacter sp.]|jgi:osmotically-inducible protein OsmY|nr:transport-associated protein [Candidatus Solibacter sp.]